MECTDGWVVVRKKPSMDILDLMLKSILETLDQFSILGISIDSPQGLVTIRTKLVMGVFDHSCPSLPSKSFVHFRTATCPCRHMGMECISLVHPTVPCLTIPTVHPIPLYHV